VFSNQFLDVVVTTTFEDLLLAAPTNLTSFSTLVDGLPSLDQRRFIPAFLKHLSDKYLNTLGSCESSESQAIIAGAARAIHICVGTNDIRLGHLVSWLTSASGAGLGDGIGIRRAVLAVVAQSRDNVIVVLEKSIAQFGDQLYVKHAPMLQQETHAQVLLLSAGYVKRISAIKLTMLMRSAVWLNAVSNRLAATQERARFLGVVVGEALSTLVDKSDKRLDFHMEETNQDEGRWYKELVNVADQPGGLDVLAPSVSVTEKTRVSGRAPEKQSISSQAATVRPSRPPPKGFVIEEVDDDESEGDDLTPYAKPDSDAEDSDDDATLVRRDKPKAPVYIRDLIRYLRDTDDFDHQKLALTTAPDLIRRKANFGSEVKDHSDELASLLVGLQDRFEIDNFFQLRLQGMIALVVAQPECMGQWFAKTFYDGDYSVSQRTSILAVLGIGARELAGFEESEYIGTSAFPSKTLPERMKRLYVDSPGASGQLSSSESLKPLPPNALDTVARSLTKQLLGPIAAEAADAVTGPDVLKISTFAARLKQQQSGPSSVRRKVASRPRIRAIPNTTAQLLFTSFFSPLVARFQAALRSSARTRGALVFQQPHLLATYLRTLGIVAHAAGPGTLALPTMTAELWGVLLRARTAGAGDMGVVRAILFSLLALLDVNEDRMKDICAEMGSQVVETMEWVSDVFDRTRGDDGGRGEENEVKMLSAAVLIRLREGVERYKALLMGDMIGY
jgi:telomere length regulation protein